MKKIFGMIIFLLIIVGAMVVCAEEFIEVSFSTEEASDETMMIIDSNMIITDVKLIAAAYNGNQLVKVSVMESDLNGYTNRIETGFNWEGINKNRVKLFVWSSDSMPYAFYEYQVGIPFKVEGVVTATPYTNMAEAQSYDEEAEPYITINGTFSHGGNDCCGKISAHSGDFDVNPYLGKSVVAYAVENTMTGEVTLTEFSEIEGMNSSVVLNSAQLVDDSNSLRRILYRENFGGETKELELNPSTIEYCNGKPVKWYMDVTSELLINMDNNGVVELVSNDGNSADYECINIRKYDGETVVRAVQYSKGEYVYETYVGKLPEFDYKSYLEVFKDGKSATVTDITAGDTVSYTEIVSGYYILDVSSETASGIITDYELIYDYDSVMIGDAVYPLSVLFTGNPAEYLEKEGTLYFNSCGQVAYFKIKPESDRNYALITEAYEEGGGMISATYCLKAVLYDGSVKTYQMNSNAKIVDAYGQYVDNVYAPDLIVEYFAKQMSGTTSAGTAVAIPNDYTADSNLLVRLELTSQGKIKKIKLLPENTSLKLITSAKYDKEENSLGGITFDENAVMFNIEQAGTEPIDTASVEVGKIADFLADGKIGCEVVAFDEYSVYGAAVRIASGNTNTSSNKIVVVSKKKEIVDGFEVYVLTGVVGGVETDIIIDVEDTFYAPTIEIGDVLDYDKLQ